MKRLAMVLAVAVLVFYTPEAVFAQTPDYITEAAEALKRSPVYVAPGTEGTDGDTASRLQARLTKDDNIVLVMFPAAARTQFGTEITTVATRLSEKLGNKRIIGLSVGNEVVGYAPTLPTGVASDQMRRAGSVSNDPFTALATYAQNMHRWERDNPQPDPEPFDSPEGEEGGTDWATWVWFGIVLVVVVFLAIIALAMTSGTDQQPTERTRFKAPDQIKGLLEQIARERRQIKDPQLRETLYQMCEDLERYFSSSSKDKKRDASFFKDRLSEVTLIVVKYVDIQNFPRYYRDWEDELRKGKDSIMDFSHYVLESIQRGNAADLLDYTVNTRILQAQRRR